MKIGFLGGGNMAEALIAGMVRGDFSPQDILVADISKDRLDYLEDAYGLHRVQTRELLEQADAVILAVKPQVLPQILSELAQDISSKILLISIAAGIPLKELEALSGSSRVIRVMPNTPALVRYGVSVLSKSPSGTVQESDGALATEIFSAVGDALWLEEEQMDAVTALSGSGPAFVYRFADAMAESGVLMGLPRDLSSRLAAGTLLGAAMMIRENPQTPRDLESKVTSPGGTTIHGLAAMEKNNFSNSVEEGILAAFTRARELGKNRNRE